LLDYKSGMAKLALSIAASDPSAGAGIEQDLKVFAGHKVFGMSAITGITIQGPSGIQKIIPTPAPDFRRILEIFATELKPDAVKLGALVSSSHLRLARKFLEQTRAPAVLDPVLKSSTGFWLLEKSAVKEIFSLFPLVELITPNLPEAEMLTGMRVQTRDDMMLLTEKLLARGARAVLLKGGHLPSTPLDILWADGRTRTFRKPRLRGKFHGTGCALASAIASNLARGFNLEKSVEKAEAYIEKAMRSAIEIKGVKYLFHADCARRRVSGPGAAAKAACVPRSAGNRD